MDELTIIVGGSEQTTLTNIENEQTKTSVRTENVWLTELTNLTSLTYKIHGACNFRTHVLFTRTRDVYLSDLYLRLNAGLKKSITLKFLTILGLS